MSTSRKGKRVTVLLAAVVVVGLPLAAWQYWPHLRFWYLFESLGVNAQGFPEFRHRQTGIVMVRLPGGTFWMGAQREDPEAGNYDPQAMENERPVHEVKLSPFLIAKFEVTQLQWRQVMGSNPSRFQGNELPVEQVSLDDLQEFKASTGLGLPTEAQWEYACRAGRTTVYCFGGDTGSLGEYCWYRDNTRDSTRPVGQKCPNAFGLHDMHGNVGEQCKDTYDAEFYSTSEAQGADPICRQPSDFTVWRGGSWGDRATRCRPAFRGRLEPSARNIVGFRPTAPCP